MQGNSIELVNYLEGNKNKFIIPVYQRKYEWKTDNCLQLFKDLCSLGKGDRESHFFGSIVANIIPNHGDIEYHIIDGQQRITTITLLYLAMYNLLYEGKLVSKDDDLKDQIYETYLIRKFKKGLDKYRLVPVAADRDAYYKLFGDPSEYDKTSNLTINYIFFYNQLLQSHLTIDDFNNAINKLEIINIALEHGDNAQLIFESLNSTGLALEEGDKIRNYVLMGQDPDTQDRLFDNYWSKIEERTRDNVSDFIRDYLSIKQQSTPNINNVYKAFKEYTESNSLLIEPLLEDLAKYAKYFERLLTCKSTLHNTALDDCLYRLKRLDVTVARPFFMEVFRLNEDHKLDVADVLKVFTITENYLFRRNICDVPTNALNKIFVSLNKEIIRYENNTENYVDKFIYALEAKKESGRFPVDEEFITELANKQVYHMRGKFKAYLFERFENYGTVETKDVYTHLDNNVYSIEHIMPQHLTAEWRDDLGDNYEEIHETWLHRLANLTLTGYNPSLSNNRFIEKRDSANGGYSTSGIRMNQIIAKKDKWTLKELQERNTLMLERAKEIWQYPSTSFVPAEKEYDSCTLDDEDVELKGRELAKFSYKNAEQPVNSWADMIEQVIISLHQQDKSVIASIAYGTDKDSELNNLFTTDPSKLRNPLQIDENIYFEKNTSTNYKVIILRRLFNLFKANPMDLVFYLKDAASEGPTGSLGETRKEYWEYALPIITGANNKGYRNSFINCNPTTNNATWGTFGISGFSVGCVANTDNARVQFYLGKGSQEKNKEAYDVLYSHKKEIEEKIGTNWIWDRANDAKASWIYCEIKNVSVTNKNDWERMAQFHARWSDEVCEAVLPYLYKLYSIQQTDDDKKLVQIAEISRQWASETEFFQQDLTHSNNTYIRGKTEFMSTLLPDVEGVKSGWNTINNYYYEIYNRNVDSIYIQLALSSKGAPDTHISKMEDLMKLCNVNHKNNWEWKTVYKTDKQSIDNVISKESVYAALNKCLEQVIAFEQKLHEEGF